MHLSFLSLLICKSTADCSIICRPISCCCWHWHRRLDLSLSLSFSFPSSSSFSSSFYHPLLFALFSGTYLFAFLLLFDTVADWNNNSLGVQLYSNAQGGRKHSPPHWHFLLVHNCVCFFAVFISHFVYCWLQYFFIMTDWRGYKLLSLSPSSFPIIFCWEISRRYAQTHSWCSFCGSLARSLTVLPIRWNWLKLQLRESAGLIDATAAAATGENTHSNSLCCCNRAVQWAALAALYLRCWKDD